ncbi:MAG: hypothetical protein AAB458_02515 [Patescibacteria group bacterium]
MKKFKKGVVVKTVLSLVALGGIVALAILAPNAVLILKTLRKMNARKAKQQEIQIATAIQRLEKKGHLVISRKGRKPMVILSESGRDLLGKYKTKDIRVSQKVPWDGKWRAVAFDISEGERSKRTLVRDVLKRCGFVYFQRSVWITPFPCDEVIASLREILNIENQIAYIVIEKIDTDEVLRKRFSL